jgi:hypothetical protein
MYRAIQNKESVYVRPQGTGHRAQGTGHRAQGTRHSSKMSQAVTLRSFKLRMKTRPGLNTLNKDKGSVKLEESTEQTQCRTWRDRDRMCGLLFRNPKIRTSVRETSAKIVSNGRHTGTHVTSHRAFTSPRTWASRPDTVATSSSATGKGEWRHTAEGKPTSCNYGAITAPLRGAQI